MSLQRDLNLRVQMRNAMTLGCSKGVEMIRRREKDNQDFKCRVFGVAQKYGRIRINDSTGVMSECFLPNSRQSPYVSQSELAMENFGECYRLSHLSRVGISS
jgi:hypothetical protein